MNVSKHKSIYVQLDFTLNQSYRINNSKSILLTTKPNIHRIKQGQVW